MIGTVFAMKWRKNKRKAMSEEKKINIEDGNLEEENKSENTQAEETVNNEEQPQEPTEEAPAEEEKDPLDVALTEIENLKQQMLYKQAEFENYRKRTIKEKAELILNGGEKTITAILPVLDDFERALADTTDDPKAIKEGMELIFHKFIKTLESLGVKKIETDDKDFDVDFHEAIAMVPGMGDDKKGKIIDCVQTGYMLNDKVIRHAKVAVGQ